MTSLFDVQQILRAHPAQDAYWRARERDWAEPTVLVRDHLRRDTAEPPRITVAVPAAVAEAGRRLTGGDPLLSTVLGGTVLALLAARATDTDLVTVFLPGAGANRAIPLTVTVAEHATGADLLREVRARYLEALAHLDVPVSALLDRADARPSDFMLALDGNLGSADAGRAGCPLLFDLRPGELTLVGDPVLFTPATARRLAHRYVRLLGVLVDDPGAAVAVHLGLDDEERDLLAGFNDTDAEFPVDRVLHGFLEEQAARNPTAVAVDGVGYGELNATANRLARTLRERGVGCGTVVGVCVPRSRDMVVAIYAVLKAGGAYLPVDPTLPRNRIDYLLEHSGTPLVLTTTATRDAVAGRRMLAVDDPATYHVDGTDLDPVSRPDDLCYVIYTSGSTGRPKGVMVTHRAIVNRLWWMQRAYPLGPQDVIAHKTPFTFDVSVWEIFWWSLAGASVVTLPGGAERDPERIAASVADAGVTTIHFVPSMLPAFLRYVEVAGAPMPSLRRVFVSGEALAGTHVEAFRRVLGSSVELVNLYGPTEAAVDVTCQPCQDVDPTRPVPIGRPIDNIRIHIRTRAGRIAPVGTPGELCIAGVGLAEGYLNAPELTAERFVSFGGGRLYRTGDLARWLPDGTVEFLGRIDNQVKIRGFRIELGEIEYVAAQVPGVADCAVTVVTDETGDRALVAYVVLGPDYNERALRAGLEAELPAYMVPQWVVEVPAIPTTHNGKRDMASLPRPATPVASGRAPRTSVEERLAAIWAEALGTDRVGIDGNFFALGGDSIKFITVLAQARAAGLRFTFAELFANPTIAELAGHVTLIDARAVRGLEPFALLAVDDRDRLPPDAVDAIGMSALQVGLFYEMSKVDRLGMYHDIMSYRIDDALDVEVFARAVDAVVARHPVFRTSFHLEGFSEPLQVVRAKAPSLLRVFDLIGLPEQVREERLREYAELELAGGFDDGTQDLVRIHIHLLTENSYQYSLSYHDAALDGWSVNTIHRDLFSAYFALLGGRQWSPPPLAASQRDYVALEQAAVASGEQRDFWLQVMDGTESTRIPRYAEPESGLCGVEILDVPLPDSLSDAILATAERLRVPVKSVLLAAHVAVLGFLSGSDDVLTGYEHSGRPEVAGGADITGLFLNTVPFRLRLTKGSWAHLVRAAYEAETELLPYRRYPMAEIKKAVGSREPLFDTVFNFTHFHVLKDLTAARDGFGLVRSIVNAQSEFPFRAELSQDATSDEVLLGLHYHRDVFTHEQVSRVGGYYTAALLALTADPEADHRATPFLGAEEERVLRGFAGPEFALPPGTFCDQFAAQVRRTPDAVAIVHGGQIVSYAEVDERSHRVAGTLAAAGVRHGDVVTTVLPRGVPWALTMLAILKLGAVYLPQDRDYPLDRIGAVLRRSRCRYVMADLADVDQLGPELARRCPGVATLGYAEGEPAHGRTGPDDTAYIIFTSGSTGDPKGATIRHSGMLNHLLSKVLDLELTGADRVAHIAVQCFDISVWQLLAAWLVGGRTVIYDLDLVMDVLAFLAGLAADRITILETVPSYTDALLTEVEQRPVVLPALRFNIINGEPLTPALTRRWFASYPGITAINAYGPTECSDDVTHHLMHKPVTSARVPVGRPIINTGLHVVGTSDALRPIGCYGEICVTGVGVGLGYVNDPERTATAFTLNTVDGRSPMLYRTGDIGRWLPDGVLDCAGRRDGQVKIRGHRIELAEIDGALDRLPGVEVAVTLARPIADELRLVSFYTGIAEPDLGRFRSRLAATIPGYMLPEILVRLDAFPLNANGKVDRRALAAYDVGLVPETHREAPASAGETFVRNLFARVLGLPEDRVGVTDNFFDIGGHSIAAMKVAALSGGRIVLRDLLTHPTARLLTAALDAGVGRRGLLVDVTGDRVVDPVATVVCLPFAGGNAVSYVGLARAFAGAGLSVRVYAVDLPGRTVADPLPLEPIERLAGVLADEVRRATVGRLAVLGHCAGSSFGLHLVAALTRQGVPVQRLMVVGKVLRSVDPHDHLGNVAVHMSEDEVMRWLVENTGLREVHDLTPAQRADLARAFRYDTVQATRGFHVALGRLRIDCPITMVVAADDTVTAGYLNLAPNWGVFTDDTRMVVADHGGHYLNLTRPELLVETLRADLGL